MTGKLTSVRFIKSLLKPETVNTSWRWLLHIEQGYSCDGEYLPCQPRERSLDDNQFYIEDTLQPVWRQQTLQINVLQVAGKIQRTQVLAQKTAVETCNHTLLPSGFVHRAWHTLPTKGPSIRVPVTAMSFIWITGMCLISHFSTSLLRLYFCNKFRTMYYTRTFTMQSIVDQNNFLIFSLILINLLKTH